jgi:nucleoside-diphosphate-sugar epimerase
VARILITGSSGSLGSRLTEKLAAEGHTCYGFDIAENSEFDLTNKKKFYDFVAVVKPAIIIHLAATIYGVAGFNENDGDILLRDMVATQNVVSAWQDFPVDHLVYTSSSMVYERLPSGYQCMENDVHLNPAPLTGYGLSKYFGEELIRLTALKNPNKTYTIFRPFNIINPREKSSRELGYSHVFADFYDNIIVKRLNPVPIIGSGYQIRSFTWIDDVVECMSDNSLNPIAFNDVFNIGRDEPIMMVDLANMIHRVGKERGLIPFEETLEFETVKSYHRDVQYRVPDISHTLNDLGFEAKTSLYDSINRLFDERMKEQ